MIRYLLPFIIGATVMAVLLGNIDSVNESNAKPIEIEQIETIEELINIVSDQEVDCLAKTIYFESGGSNLAGKLAVGLVVLNRQKHINFPGTVCQVVQQGKVSKTSAPCQFSWYCDGKSDIPIAGREWESSKKVANILLREKVFDFTDGATNFHNSTVNPKWAGYRKVAQIDGHTFYRK